MGYHKKKIDRGVFGEYSKIVEEIEEFKDAHEQYNRVMELVELSDLLGAIEAYIINEYNMNLCDLLVMKNATKSAFEEGDRQPR